jgi:hypothetical protein
MANNVLNISGLVYQGPVMITSGYVRAQNTNKSDLIAVVPIGEYETGDLEAARYDIWFRALSGQPNVCDADDIIELSVYNNLVNVADLLLPTIPPSVNVNRLFPVKLMSPLTTAQVSSSYVAYNIQGVTNELPGLPVIKSEENTAFTSQRILEWVWRCPTDPDSDTVHFQLEWSQNPSFPSPGGTNRYDTRNGGDVVSFTYESATNYWRPFPTGGLISAHYGKKCKFRIEMAGAGTYYWRVRATDNIDR